jgi:putative ABC transport system permease protein
VAAAAAAVSGVTGATVWSDIPTGRLVVTALTALAAGAVVTAARLVPRVRAGRRSAVTIERRLLARGWKPAWLRARLDFVAVGAGFAILAGNVLAGGLRPTPVEGQALALSFYVLLAPIALWVGATLLAARLLLALLARWSRPDRQRPLTSWPSAVMRWLGRRPARTTVALVLGALAVAFGTEVSTFVATYRSAKVADTRAAFGADLRLVPTADRVQGLPPLGPDVRATTTIRSVPARVGSDRKTVMALDPGSYRAVAAAAPRIVRGGGLDALFRGRGGVLVAQEIATTLAVTPGDTLPVTVFPDDLDRSQKIDLHVVGVYRALPPTDPPSELVIATPTLPAPAPPEDLYLARVAPGRDPDRVAAALRPRLTAFSVTTIRDRTRLQQRSLTALNLDGLGRIEEGAAGLMAAVGVGLLGAFLVLERRRELAVLRTVGAGTREILTGPLVEGLLATSGSLVLGIPVGLGLGALAVRVLGLFFALPPPLASVPVGRLVTLAALVIGTSGVAFGLALRAATRVDPGPVLRET